MRVAPLFVLAAALFLGGCVTTPPKSVDVIDSLVMVGDGWFVAALDSDRRTSIQTKKLPSKQVAHTHFYRNGIIRTSYAMMREWGMRFVNSSEDWVCMRPVVIQVDYDVGIFDKWHVVQPMATRYVGNITQHPFFTLERVMSYDAAKWKIEDIIVTDYNDEEGCYVKDNS